MPELTAHQKLRVSLRTIIVISELKGGSDKSKIATIRQLCHKALAPPKDNS